jgi:hypothetical protein
LVPLQRVEGDVDARDRPLPQPADLLADVEHRGLVALSLADDHRALDVQRVEGAAHGVDRRLIGQVLLPLAPSAGPRRSPPAQ